MLEQALYTYHFDKPKAKAVLQALQPYQNEDGGFGNALEPDIRLSDSSVIATTVAFQIFRDIGADFASNMVRDACEYLKATYSAEAQTWANIPSNIDDAAHAPWWAPQSDLSGYMANPRAEIVGYLHDYGKNFSEPPFDETWRTSLTEAVVEWLLEQNEEIEQHDLLCYVRLARTAELPDGVRLILRRRLEGVLRESVETEEWGGYTLTPLDVLDGPKDPFAYLFQEAVERQLDSVVKSLEEQPYIDPPWGWDGEEWAQAQKEWRGVLTLKRMVQLKRFGRL